MTPVVLSQQFDCTISEQQRIVHELVLYDRTRLFSRTPSRTVRTANRTPNRTVRSYTAVQSYIQKYCTIVCQGRNRVVQTLPNTSQIACSAQKNYVYTVRRSDFGDLVCIASSSSLAFPHCACCTIVQVDTMLYDRTVGWLCLIGTPQRVGRIRGADKNADLI
jgi:hypothetical protein